MTVAAERVHHCGHGSGHGRRRSQSAFFNYPTLFIYLCFACYALYYVAGHLFGVFHSSLDLGLSFLIDPSPFYLISRTLSALAGVTSVYVLYLLCRRFFNQRIAGLAALLLAVAPLHVRDSHFGVTDVFMLLLTLIALYYVLAFNESGGTKDAGLAALFAGLAASSKYTAALILAPLALIILLQLRSTAARRLPRIGGLSLVAFALFFTSPYVILDLENFIADFSFESDLCDGHLGIFSAAAGFTTCASRRSMAWACPFFSPDWLDPC